MSKFTLLMLLSTAIGTSAASASVLEFNSVGAWDTAVGSSPAAQGFASLPGNDQTLTQPLSIGGVSFTSSGALVSCGGSFPSNCSGAGGFLLGYPDFTETLSPNTSGVAGNFGAYYGNSPAVLDFTVTTVGGSSYTKSIDPGTSLIFEGFVSTSASDPISTLMVKEENSRNYAAETQFFTAQTSATPEPSTLLLLGTGLIAAAVVTKRRKAAR